MERRLWKSLLKHSKPITFRCINLTLDLTQIKSYFSVFQAFDGDNDPLLFLLDPVDDDDADIFVLTIFEK